MQDMRQVTIAEYCKVIAAKTNTSSLADKMPGPVDEPTQCLPEIHSTSRGLEQDDASTAEHVRNLERTVNAQLSTISDQQRTGQAFGEFLRKSSEEKKKVVLEMRKLQGQIQTMGEKDIQKSVASYEERIKYLDAQVLSYNQNARNKYGFDCAKSITNINSELYNSDEAMMDIFKHTATACNRFVRMPCASPFLENRHDLECLLRKSLGLPDEGLISPEQPAPSQYHGSTNHPPSSHSSNCDRVGL